MKKLTYYFALLLLFPIGVMMLSLEAPAEWVRKMIAPSVLADDDEEDEKDEKDEEDEEDEEDEKKYIEEDEDKDESKSETKTTYIKLPDQIIKRLITETIYDSDGDGIFDPDDSTPNINNAFIVEDKNFNGIADSYEKQ